MAGETSWQQSMVGSETTPVKIDVTSKKGTGVVAGGLAASATTPSSAAGAESPPSENPYGARPGGGSSLPDYYKPWPAIKNGNMYLPGTEFLPKNEMRVTFLGSSPWPPKSFDLSAAVFSTNGT